MYFRDPARVISLFQDTIPLTFDPSGVKYAGRNTKGLNVYRTRLESIQLTPKGEGVELYRSGYRNQVGLILVVHYHGTKLPGPTCCRGHWPGHHKNRPRHGLESSRRDWFLHRRLIPISDHCFRKFKERYPICTLRNLQCGVSCEETAQMYSKESVENHKGTCIKDTLKTLSPCSYPAVTNCLWGNVPQYWGSLICNY